MLLLPKNNLTNTMKQNPMILLSLVRFTKSMARMSLGPLMPLLAAEMDFTSPTTMPALETTSNDNIDAVVSNNKASLLSAFSSGYMLTQIVGGYLADRYGAPKVIAATCIWTSFILLVLVQQTMLSVSLWTRLYFVMGLVNGPLFPACSVIISSSVDQSKRARFVAIIDTFAAAGMCVATLAPILAAYTWHGWKGMFVILSFAEAIAGLACVFCLSPPLPVGTKQKKKKNNSTWTSTRTVDTMIATTKSSLTESFGILISPQTLSLYVCHSCDNFCKYVLNAWCATMLVEQFNVKVTIVGGLLALQEGVGVIAKLGFGLYDFAGSQNRWLSSATVFASQGIMLWVAFNSPSVEQCFFFFTISSICSGGHSIGYRPTYLESGKPEYAGIRSGCGNTVASLAATVGPVVIGVLVGSANNDTGDNNNSNTAGGKWERVGLLLAFVNMVGIVASYGLQQPQNEQNTVKSKKAVLVSKMEFYSDSVYDSDESHASLRAKSKLKAQ